MRFSLIIPTLNRVEEVKNILISLENQLFKDFEVIIVDQNEKDILKFLLDDYKNKLNITHLRIAKLGASNARNQGVTQAKGEILTFPDDDCEYPENLLEIVDSYFKDNSYDGITITTKDKNNEKPIAMLKSKTAKISRKNILKTVIEAGIFIYKNKLGRERFDEKLGVGSSSGFWSDEGPDLILRLIEKNVVIQYCPEVKMFHPDPVKTYNEKTMIRSYNYGKGRGYFLRKNKFKLNAIAYYLLIYLGGMVKSLLCMNKYMFLYFLKGFKGRFEGYFDDIKVNFFLNFLFLLIGLSIPISYAFNSIMLACFFFFSFCFFSKSNYLNFFHKNQNYVFILFIVIFIYSIIGITYSYDTVKAIKSVERQIVYLIIPIGFINFRKRINRKHLNFLFAGFLISVLSLIIYAYINIVLLIIRSSNSINSMLSFYVRDEFVGKSYILIHPPYFGLLSFFAVIIAFYLPFLNKNMYLKTFKVFIILLLIFSIYSVSSFMAFLLLCIFIASIYIEKCIKFKMINKVLLLLITSLTIMIVLNNKNVLIKYIYDDKNHSTIYNRFIWSFEMKQYDWVRINNWKSVISVVKENTIFGVGSDGGIEQLKKYRDPKSEISYNNHNAHNQFLEFLLRLGVIGLLIFLFLFISFVCNAFNSGNRIYIWFMVVNMMYFITESTLVRQIGLTFFVFISCFLITISNKNQKKMIDE